MKFLNTSEPSVYLVTNPNVRIERPSGTVVERFETKEQATEALRENGYKFYKIMNSDEWWRNY